MFKVLREGTSGAEVERWQTFLLGIGFDPKGIDGVFGKETLNATIAFQLKHRLEPDGIVGDRTLGKAATLGLAISEDDSTESAGIGFPPKPGFGAMTHTRRTQVFGSFEFAHDPRPGNHENVRVIGDWAQHNIVTVVVPQLVGVKGAGGSGRATIHVGIKTMFLELWRQWESRHLLDRILTWDGAYVPRFQRGAAIPANRNDASKLSNHAWGTAFDINAKWNPLGSRPALKGERGCVRELVEVANELGFFWGGHFSTRWDGMHFEAVRRD